MQQQHPPHPISSVVAMNERKSDPYWWMRRAFAELPDWNSILTLMAALGEDLTPPHWDVAPALKPTLLRSCEAALIGQTAVRYAEEFLSKVGDGDPCLSEPLWTVQELAEQLSKTAAQLRKALTCATLLKADELSALKGALWAVSTTDPQDRAHFLEVGLKQMHFCGHGRKVAYLRLELTGAGKSEW